MSMASEFANSSTSFNFTSHDRGQTRHEKDHELCSSKSKAGLRNIVDFCKNHD